MEQLPLVDVGSVLKVRLFGDHWGKISNCDNVMMAVLGVSMPEL